MFMQLRSVGPPRSKLPFENLTLNQTPTLLGPHKTLGMDLL